MNLGQIAQIGAGTIALIGLAILAWGYFISRPSLPILKKLKRANLAERIFVDESEMDVSPQLLSWYLQGRMPKGIRVCWEVVKGKTYFYKYPDLVSKSK